MSSKIEQLKTKSDQNKEKFRIRTEFVLSIKKRAKAPMRGNKIKADNIFIKELEKSRFHLD